MPGEAAKMEAWLRAELAKARDPGAKQLIVFQHIPFFLKDPGEDGSVLQHPPRDARRATWKILHEYGVQQVFAGHHHRNSEGRDGDLEMITTGPVGMPLEDGKSGMRIVVVKDGGVTQSYYDFGELPQ